MNISVMAEASCAKLARASAGMATRPRQNSRLRVAFLLCVLRSLARMERARNPG
jgi:hypothetical protein